MIMKTKIQKLQAALLSLTIFVGVPCMAQDILWLGPIATLTDTTGKIIVTMDRDSDPSGHIGRLMFDTATSHFDLVASGAIELMAYFPWRVAGFPAPPNPNATNNTFPHDFVFVYGGNYAYTNSFNHWWALSDRRAKKDIRDFSGGLAELENLHPVAFKYNGKAALAPDDGVEYVGLVAQDLRKVFPFMVQESDAKIGGQPILTVDSSALTYVLVNSVKEEAGSVATLDARLDRIQHVLCAKHPKAKACL
jgi:hypothetical protein